MPELPEVETVRRGLERSVVGRTIESVDIRVPKIFTDDRSIIDQHLIGIQVTAVERRAKVLLLSLSSGWTLAIHLKMTGQLVVRHQATGIRQQGFAGGHPEKAYEQPLPHKHTHVIITFSDGTVLYFNDLRKFGWLRLLSKGKTQKAEGKTKGKTENLTVDEFLSELNHGPEPLSDEFTIEGFQTALKRRRIPIKTALLDQSIIAGVGNIYADEALFRAEISPRRKASALKRSEVQRLFRAIPEVLNLGIEHGGTTFNSYQNVEGTAGKMREHLNVYGREGLPCPVCGTPIERIKIGQRSSHYCPRCQR